MTVRVGAQIHPQHASYARMREVWLRVEEMGADTLFNWDHFFPLYGESEGQHFECWTMLAAMAEVTERVEFGALVTCNSYRNANLLADMARSVDHISGGRLILGLGSGWFRKDYDEYGYEFGTAGGRLDLLAESLPRIESRLGALNPAPTRKIPVLIGGGGEKKTLKLVARYADACNLFAYGGPEAIRHKLDVLKGRCEDIGRDYDEIEKTALGTVELAPGAMSADQVIDMCRDLGEAGIEHLIFNMPNVHEIEPLEAFGREVIPAVTEL